MPHRAYHIIVGIAGLFFVAALLLAGANLLRHSRSGPGWKQRLVSAGLLLLGALGFGSLGAGVAGCKQGADTAGKPPVTTPDTPDTPDKPDKPDTPDKPDKPDKPSADKPADAMRHLAALQAEAEAIAKGKKGQHPFDRATKQQLLDALRKGQDRIDDLQQAGTINAGEAGLWKADLTFLAGKVAGFRPTEMKNATCYQPRAIPPPGSMSLARLRRRLPLLEKLATADKLNPEVTRKVLRRIELDLGTVGEPAGGADKALVGEARALVAKIKARLDGKQGAAAPNTSGDVTGSAWATIKAAWRFIAPLAANSSKSTNLQRRQATEKMKQALAALDGLAAAGKLSAPEAGLLKTQAARLQEEMRRSPPADYTGRCYRRAAFVPAKSSLQQLNRRLPLLSKLVAAGKVHPQVLARVVPALERDLKILTTPEELKRLWKDDGKKVPRAVRRARALLARLKTLGK